MLYVADSGNNAVRAVVLATGAVATLAGGGTSRAPIAAGAAAADGVGGNATLAAPAGLAWLPVEGLLLLSEAGGNRLRAVNVTVRLPFAWRLLIPCSHRASCSPRRAAR